MLLLICGAEHTHTMGVGAVAVNTADAERSQFYTGATTWYVIIIAIVAASGGLIFGFDNGEAVISLQDRRVPDMYSTLGWNLQCSSVLLLVANACAV
jgi:hypothetical protein